jgi:glycosyltransferase involved in cell wall biosynthesis
MKYSFLMPTYNSMRWIKTSIRSLLEQTYTHFDIIIVDSGSSDGTIEWLKSIGDDRIRIFESDKRLNIVENWSRFTSIPKGKYMTIMGHDDKLYPSYLHTIDKLINSYPDAGLFQTHFNFIDGKGNVIRACAPMRQQYSPTELTEAILKHDIEITATGFMMLSELYDGVGGIPDYPNLLYADTELWIKMILNSCLVVAPETCFEFRFHIENTSKSPGPGRLNAFERMVDFLSGLKGKNRDFASIIDENAENFLRNYAIGSCHKLLYVPKNNRGGVTMDKIVNSARRCAQKLIPGKRFEPNKFGGIVAAKAIDSNIITRNLFLFFKSYQKRTF